MAAHRTPEALIARFKIRLLLGKIVARLASAAAPSEGLWRAFDGHHQQPGADWCEHFNPGVPQERVSDDETLEQRAGSICAGQFRQDKSFFLYRKLFSTRRNRQLATPDRVNYRLKFPPRAPYRLLPPAVVKRIRTSGTTWAKIRRPL